MTHQGNEAVVSLTFHRAVLREKKKKLVIPYIQLIFYSWFPPASKPQDSFCENQTQQLVTIKAVIL